MKTFFINRQRTIAETVRIDAKNLDDALFRLEQGEPYVIDSCEELDNQLFDGDYGDEDEE